MFDYLVAGDAPIRHRSCSALLAETHDADIVRVAFQPCEC